MNESAKESGRCLVAPCLRRSIAISCSCIVPCRVFGAGAPSASLGATFRGRPRRFGGASTGAVSAPAAGSPAELVPSLKA
jgi:hypothetical protein